MMLWIRNRQVQRFGIVLIFLLITSYLCYYTGIIAEVNFSRDRSLDVLFPAPAQHAPALAWTGEYHRLTSQPNDTARYESFLCNETFNATLEDNIEVIKNYPRGLADKYMWKIGGNLDAPTTISAFPVFVTALNDQYYNRSLGLFSSLNATFMSKSKYTHQIRLIVYDLGMSSQILKKVKERCQCEIRKFPFEEFPSYVKHLKTYAFKPIIIKAVFMEFGFVWWMDTSVRFLTAAIEPAIRQAVDSGFFFAVSNHPTNEISVTQQTDIQTFKFLGEDPCKFRPYSETWATTLMFHYNPISNIVVNAWTACALNRNCIAPAGTERKLVCILSEKYDGRCHRFDQSMISILTRRLYHDHNRYPLNKRADYGYMFVFDKHSPI